MLLVQEQLSKNRIIILGGKNGGVAATVGRYASLFMVNFLFSYLWGRVLDSKLTNKCCLLDWCCEIHARAEEQDQSDGQKRENLSQT